METKFICLNAVNIILVSRIGQIKKWRLKIERGSEWTEDYEKTETYGFVYKTI
jgi:hypothetical protein